MLQYPGQEQLQWGHIEGILLCSLLWVAAHRHNDNPTPAAASLSLRRALEARTAEDNLYNYANI